MVSASIKGKSKHVVKVSDSMNAIIRETSMS